MKSSGVYTLISFIVAIGFLGGLICLLGTGNFVVPFVVLVSTAIFCFILWICAGVLKNLEILNETNKEVLNILKGQEQSLNKDDLEYEKTTE